MPRKPRTDKQNAIILVLIILSFILLVWGLLVLGSLKHDNSAAHGVKNLGRMPVQAALSGVH